MSLAIVILNYRTIDLTLDCLRSLAKSLDGLSAVRAVVVDNGSGDGSAERIANEIESQGWTNWMTLMALPKNMGFAGGNNRALEKLAKDDDYVLLLNSDTLVSPATLAYCRNVMEKDSAIGAMSCMLRNPDGSVQTVMRDFPSPMRQFLCAIGLPWIFPRLFGWANVYDVPDNRLIEKHDCDWLGGAFLFIRRTALDRTGLLDEDFFFYGEDVEFCHRMRRIGYRIHYDPAMSIIHRGGASSDPTRMKVTERDRHRWQAKYLIQQKCYGRLAAMMIRWADIFTLKIRQTKLLLRRQRQTEPYRGVCEAIGYLRTLRP